MILNRQKKRKIDTKRAAVSLRRILNHLGCRGGEVNVVYIDDEKIRKYNREYLGRNKPTNVISFSMAEGEFGNLDAQVLGDILISVESAERDAADFSFELHEMLDYLMIHGVLHLLGYHHESDVESAKKMLEKERELFFLLYGYQIDSLSP
jgi:probable rRNA maturation factor